MTGKVYTVSHVLLTVCVIRLDGLYEGLWGNEPFWPHRPGGYP